MPDITIIKLKIRRGTDNQRKTIVLEQGELGYSTDTRRVFVGDGITVGGVPVSNVNHAPIFDQQALVAQKTAVVNDFVFAGTYLYQLTATDYSSLSSWARISNNLLADNVSIGYTTVNGVDSLKIKDGGITGSMFNSSAAYYQGGLSATNSGLRANVDNETLTITNSNQLSVYKIDHRHISKDSFTLGVTGGEGKQIQLYTDPAFFSFNEDNSLTLIDIPDESVGFTKLDLNIFGDGLVRSGEQIKAAVQGALPSGGLEEDGYGNILISNTCTPGNSFFRSLEYNTKGQILSADYTILTTLSCDTTSPVLSVFNGNPSQTALGMPYANQTILTVLSTSGPNYSLSSEQVVLSSAGFIGFESTTSRDGMPVGRFAIPIFTY
jgi:hypothetical protein